MGLTILTCLTNIGPFINDVQILKEGGAWGHLKFKRVRVLKISQTGQNNYHKISKILKSSKYYDYYDFVKPTAVIFCGAQI